MAGRGQKAGNESRQTVHPLHVHCVFNQESRSSAVHPGPHRGEGQALSLVWPGRLGLATQPAQAPSPCSCDWSPGIQAFCCLPPSMTRLHTSHLVCTDGKLSLRDTAYEFCLLWTPPVLWRKGDRRGEITDPSFVLF